MSRTLFFMFRWGKKVHPFNFYCCWLTLKVWAKSNLWLKFEGRGQQKNGLGLKWVQKSINLPLSLRLGIIQFMFNFLNGSVQPLHPGKFESNSTGLNFWLICPKIELLFGGGGKMFTLNLDHFLCLVYP